MNKDEKTTLDTEKLSDKELNDVSGGMYIIKPPASYVCSRCGKKILNMYKIEHDKVCPRQTNGD